MTSFSLAPGVWILWAQWDLAALGSETDCQVALSLNSGNTTTDHVQGINQLSMATVAAAGVGSANMTWVVPITVATGATTVYMKAKLTGAVGNSLTGSVVAIQWREATDAY